MNASAPSDGHGIDARRARRDRQIIESVTEFAIIVTDRDGIVTEWNPGARHILGWTAEEMVGRSADTVFTPEDRASGQSEREMAASIELGRGVDERWHVKRDGTRFWASGEIMPLRDDEGAHIGFVKILRDRTENHLVGIQLKEAAERQRFSLEIGRVGVFDLDLSTNELLWDDRVRAAFGVLSNRRVTQEEKLTAIHPSDRAAFDEAAAGVRNGETFNLRFRAVGLDDGIVRWVDVLGRMVTLDGKSRFLGAVRDVSDQVAVDERRTLLSREMAHRLKNTLAIVQSIATQTLRNAPDLAAARTSLSQRIQALSKAHDILISGQHDAGALDAVIRHAVSLHDHEGQIAIGGPALHIGPKAALTLALVMNELSTNAAKYGALSVPEGRVRVGWTVDVDPATRHPAIALEWVETDGPPAVPPTRKGFGTRLIEMGLSGSTGGQTDLDYAPGGLRCRITASLTELQADDE